MVFEVFQAPHLLGSWYNRHQLTSVGGILIAFGTRKRCDGLCQAQLAARSEIFCTPMTGAPANPHRAWRSEPNATGFGCNPNRRKFSYVIMQ